MGDTFSTIEVQRQGPTARLILARPDRRNAFDGALVAELRQALRAANEDAAVRVVVVTGAGKSFCAGVDMEWFAAGRDAASDQNLSECLELAALFRELYTGPKPVIAAVNGAAMGGGVGLVAAADVAIAAASARFSLAATTFGLVPTCVVPYLIKRCGEGQCRELLLTSEHFDAPRALAIGLVQRVVPDTELPDAVAAAVDKLLQCGPGALALTKRALAELADLPIESATRTSAEQLARLRRSDEVAAGIDAFLNKRRPAWRPGQG
ncbi:MAG: enoyl-CoA hydratase/isomerase family protein [Deltaproteobacteria bacterium]|nr:enoyl-CoA hydratase/isomerase family protein [Deltaproteobacteria bacterium]